MPLEDWIQHSKVNQFLYDWQTLIAGILAVFAAVGTIWTTVRSAGREIAASQAQTAAAQKGDKKKWRAPNSFGFEELTVSRSPITGVNDRNLTSRRCLPTIVRVPSICVTSC